MAVDNYYGAMARKMDPLTGALEVTGTGAWTLGMPMAEVVLRCLRTRKGAARRDPTYGVDLTGLDNARPNAAAVAQMAIEQALARWVLRREIMGLVVQAEVVDGTLRFEVTFSDVSNARYGVRGVL